MTASANLHWKMLSAIAIGLAGGLLLQSAPTSLIEYIGLPGQILVRGLKMVVVPLVLVSIINGFLSLGGQQRSSGKLFGLTASYYLTTSLSAIVTGLILVNLIEPGVGANLAGGETVNIAPSKFGLVSFISNLIPTNPFQAIVTGDMLPAIVFAMFVALAANQLADSDRQKAVTFFTIGNRIIETITHWFLVFAPIGIASLLAQTFAQLGFDWVATLLPYALTVLLALGLHVAVMLPIAVYSIANVKPRELFTIIRQPAMLAFSTASSAATLPVTLRACETSPQVKPTVARFVLPIGATVNMDGTALYECVAVLYIAQGYGIDLTLAQQSLVVFTALAVSIGAAGIPMAGLVMMTVILDSVGLPAEAIGIILAVDRLLDMARTTVNVISDACGTIIVSALWSPMGPSKT